MLIRHAELQEGTVQDVRIADGRIIAIGQLEARGGETVLDASGGLLLPGLHDHHIHVAALAASLSSVRCGPPQVNDAASFAAALQRPGVDWLRGIGYHEQVAGMLDAASLDRIAAQRPIRIQHRTGRIWFFNTAGLELLLQRGAPPLGLERVGNRYTGRLFDEDDWLRRTLGSELPSFAQVGALLASVGITGLTDVTPANDARVAQHFAAEIAAGALPQHVLLAGSINLTAEDLSGDVKLGPAKLHLHEAALPALDTVVQFIQHAHACHRNVAVHCASETELAYTLAAFAEAGALTGDRIEHASVASDLAVAEIRRMGLAVVTQPGFIHERGDIYRTTVDACAQPYLYRLDAFLRAGVPLAGSSDAPFGGHDPWAVMAAAVSRRTRQGYVIGEAEALTPEQALDLFLAAPEALGQRRRVMVGGAADLCLLDRPWAQARQAFSAMPVRATIVAGRLVFQRTPGVTER